MTERQEVRQLRATITAITGKVPQSTSIKHLRERMKMLVAQQPVPTPTPAPAPERPTSLDVLLGGERAALARRVAGGAVSAVDVVRRAFDEYAVKHGHGAAVSAYQRTSR